MGKLFNLDSPILKVLGTLADMCLLNIMTLIGCLPVVTAGASITAMHYVLLKMVRNEEGYVWKDFWKSFKENFWQGMAIGSILIIFVAPANSNHRTHSYRNHFGNDLVHAAVTTGRCSGRWGCI